MRDAKESAKSRLIEGKYSFKELIDFDELERILALFSEATGFTIVLATHPKRELLIETGWRKICTDFHRAEQRSNLQCIESDLELSENTEKINKTLVSPKAM